MKRKNLIKTLSAAILIGGTIAVTSALAVSPQGGSGMGGMMDGYGSGWMGGYGGIWVPILIVVAVAGFVAWLVTQKKK